MDRWQLIKKSNKKSWIMYGQSHTSHTSCFTNIFDKPDLVLMCFCDSEEYSVILKLKCTLHDIQNGYNLNEYDPHYFGWIDIKENSQLKNVWPSLVQCKMCMDNSEIKQREEAGEGVIVRLNIESLGVAPKEDYLPKPLVVFPVPEIEEAVIPARRRKIMWKVNDEKQLYA